MYWSDCRDVLPEPMTEVLVWIDGKRGPQWRNNHPLVAYLAPNGEWFEERHRECGPLIGVLCWSEIEIPRM
jgi:hypothetical protein